MPKVSDEHREAMKLRIQNAALACLSRKGFSAVSMADIISEAQLSAGAVYLYYKGKEQLIVDVGQRALGERLSFLKGLRDHTPLPSPADAVTMVFNELSQGSLPPGLPVQVWGESVGNPELQRSAASIMEVARVHVADYVAAWLRQQHQASDHDARDRAEILAPALLGLVQGFMIQVNVSDAPDETAQRYKKAATTLLAGL